MTNNMTLMAEAKKTRFDLGETARVLVLYLVHMPTPVSIDSLVSLSGQPIVDILNAIEDLKKKRVVHERKEYGRGVYSLDNDKLKDVIEKIGSKAETEKVRRKLIEFYAQSSDNQEDSVLALAELFLRLEDIGEGLSHIKKAAQILYGSGNQERALVYYESLLQYFQKNRPTAENVRDYLHAVLAKISISMFTMPINERLPLLAEAEEVAKQYKEWASLMRIKLAIGQVLQATGQFQKASEYIREFWKSAARANDPAVQRKAVLMITDYLFFGGRISEVVRRYENKIGSLEEFGDNEGALRAGATIGHCYVLSGRVARGLGMIEAVRAKADLLNLNNVIMLADTLTACSLLEIRKVDEAEYCINKMVSNVPDPGPFMLQGIDACKAFIMTARQKYDEAFQLLKKSFERLPVVGQAAYRRPFILECLGLLESKGFFDEEMNCDGEIKRLLNQENIYIKGVAYRYRALRNMGRQRFMKSILPDLKASEKYLKLSGAEIELARTRIALGNHYLKNGEPKRAKAYFEKAWNLLSKNEVDLFPKDLLAIIPQQQKFKVMIDTAIDINESLATIRDIPSFLERVINVAMDFTMAMRGIFFVVDEDGPKILASRNFDPSLLNTPRFKFIGQVVEHVIRENREMVMPGLAFSNSISEESLREAHVTSLICMPSSLNNRVYGYLYLDNRLGGTSFPENQIPFVRMLSSQTAVGLWNIGIYKEISEMKDRFEEETIFYKREMGLAAPIETIIGESEGIKQVKTRIQQVALTDTSVLILGATGVGKELVAKAIHNLSERRDARFIPVNLAALPPDLLASELFGHEKGAFTGAGETQKGRFELADGGTIFLDEIGDLPAGVQAQLLRVLQEGEFERLGSARRIRANFRVIAATNKDLDAEVEKGVFRRDLYYRLNVFPIHVPLLKQRRDDIPRLAHFFTEKFSRKLGKRIRRIPGGEMKKLIEYHWPGNIRELEHCVEKAVILSDGHGIGFPDLDQTPASSIPDYACNASLADIERDYILKVLDMKHWKISGPRGAAMLLGLKPQTLHSRMKKLGITREK